MITAASSIYTYNYYKVVGINIFSYLDVSEILLLQFKLLVQTGFMLLAGFLSIISFFATMAHFFAPNEVETEIMIDTNKENKTEIATKAAIRNIASWFDNPFITLNTCIILTVAGWGLHFLFIYKSPVLFPTFATVGEIGILVIIAVLFNKGISAAFSKLYAGKYFSDRPLADDIGKMTKQLVFIEIIIIGVLITALSGQVNMYEILLGSTSNSATIILEKKIITTNDTLIYIGRTHNFIFLYDKIKEEAQIIPADKIEQLNLRKGEKSLIIPASYRNPKFFKPVALPTKNPPTKK